MIRGHQKSVRTGERGEAAPHAARLDQSVDKSTQGEVMGREQMGDEIAALCYPLVLVPVASRSALDWHGGGRSRWCQAAALFAHGRAVVAIAESEGRQLVGVTLTNRRDTWLSQTNGDDEAAARLCWRTMAPRLCVAMRRAGVSDAWCRASEVQTATGSGWMHHHLVVAIPREVSVRAWTARVEARWAALGGGYVAVRRAERKDGSFDPWLKYMVKYLAKGWKAFPPMLDHESVVQSPRLHGAAKRVVALAREMSDSPIRLKLQVAKRKRRSRRMLPLAVRLDQCGSSHAVREVGMADDGSPKLVRGRPLLPVALCREGARLAERAGVLRHPAHQEPVPACGRWGYPLVVADAQAFCVWLTANRSELQRVRDESIEYTRCMRFRAWEEPQRQCELSAPA